MVLHACCEMRHQGCYVLGVCRQGRRIWSGNPTDRCVGALTAVLWTGLPLRPPSPLVTITLVLSCHLPPAPGSITAIREKD